MRALDPRLWRRAREVRLALTADAALGVAAALLVLAQAALLARVASGSFDGSTLHELSVPLAAMVVVVTLRAATGWGFEAVGRLAALRVLSRLRMAVAAKRVTDQPAALDGAASADLATVTVAGIDALETLLARYVPQLVLAVVVPIAVLAYVAWIDPTSAALMALTLPLVPVFMWLVGRYSEQRTRERWRALGQLSAHFMDVVRGLPTLRAFNRSDGIAEQVAAVSDRYRAATMQTLRVAFLSGAVLDLAATLGVALVAVTVGVRLVDGDLGFRTGLTVLVLAPELYAPLRALGAQYHASMDGAAVSGRLLDILDAPPMVRSGARVAPDPSVSGVRFDAVTFTYPTGSEPVVSSIDLTLEPCETVALLGPSGAGKSTFAALLLGLIEPTAGRVLAGDVPLVESDLDSWRRSIAWVPQRPTLLRTTIMDNIRLGRPAAGREEVEAAARLAGADRFIDALPEGYATVIGEGARTLSAGERQRISLARAFLRDAPLVVLDEPTANLDPAARRLVRAAIEELRGSRTVLLIVHAPDLAGIADRVVRLDGGRILEAVPTGAR